MSHDCVLLSPRSNFWNWESLSIGIFEWVRSATIPGGKQRSAVKVKVVTPLSQEGIDKAKIKVAEVIRALDYGMYKGPTVIKLN